MTLRIYCVTALLIAASANAQVQPDVIEVDLLGSGCEQVGDTIQVVRNGDDQNSFAIRRLSGVPCSWRGRAPYALDRSDFFSIRLHGARTPVRRLFGFKN